MWRVFPVGDKSSSREISEEAMTEVQVTMMEVEECWGEEAVGSREVSEVELTGFTDGLGREGKGGLRMTPRFFCSNIYVGDDTIHRGGEDWRASGEPETS